tara:strand:- start:207 stop:380 length:174 start_codon:yes stop_codon:yes gene_type:complete
MGHSVPWTRGYSLTELVFYLSHCTTENTKYKVLRYLIRRGALGKVEFLFWVSLKATI